jgi:proline iminopeptidase
MRVVFAAVLTLFSIVVFGQSHFTDSIYINTSDSVKLFVKRSGNGYPVLFIHGGPGSNSYYFEKEGGDVFSQDVQLSKNVKITSAE